MEESGQADVVTVTAAVVWETGATHYIDDITVEIDPR